VSVKLTDFGERESDIKLCARIAIEVMGWEEVQSPTGLAKENAFWISDNGETVWRVRPTNLWQPDTSIKDAWEVAEKVRSLNEMPKGRVDLVVKVALGDRSFCEIFDMSPMGYEGQEWAFPDVYVEACTAPKAICLAAEEAVKLCT